VFTGIVEELGTIVAIDVAPGATDARLTVDGPVVTSDAHHGDSIAVNGACLTVVGIDGGTFTAELMAETLAKTTAGSWRPGTRVNLERSVTPTTRLGGHLVQGHVDGVGTVASHVGSARYDDVAITVPRALGKYIAPKGAIAVDGVSLTVIDVTDSGEATTFTLGIIPETRAATTMGRRAVGDTVNIEVDVMAKYAERLLGQRGGDTAPGSRVEGSADQGELTWHL
jgi:riboflavin synthase